MAKAVGKAEVIEWFGQSGVPVSEEEWKSLPKKDKDWFKAEVEKAIIFLK